MGHTMPYRTAKLWQVEPTLEVFQELMHVAAEAAGANDGSRPLLYMHLLIMSNKLEQPEKKMD